MGRSNRGKGIEGPGIAKDCKYMWEGGIEGSAHPWRHQGLYMAHSVQLPSLPPQMHGLQVCRYVRRYVDRVCHIGHSFPVNTRRSAVCSPSMHPLLCYTENASEAQQRPGTKKTHKKTDQTSRQTQAGIGHSPLRTGADMCTTGSGAGKCSGAKSNTVRRRSNHARTEDQAGREKRATSGTTQNMAHAKATTYQP